MKKNEMNHRHCSHSLLSKGYNGTNTKGYVCKQCGKSFRNKEISYLISKEPISKVKMKETDSKPLNPTTSLKDVNLSPRALRVAELLTGVNIDKLTIYDLSKYRQADFKKYDNIGIKTIADIKALLSCVGLSLQ